MAPTNPAAAEPAENPGKPAGPLGGFQSWDHLKRFVIMCAAVAAILVAVALVFKTFGILFNSQYFSIGFAGEERGGNIRQVTFERHGLQITLEDRTVLANAFIPANQTWLAVGIPVRKGDVIRLQASGLVNLSAPNTLELNNRPIRYGNFPNYLVTPEGRSVGPNSGGYRATDDWRDPIKLMPKARLGTLIGTVAPAGQRPQILPRPAVMFSLDQAMNGIKYDQEAEGCLFLSVNDLVVDPTERSRAIYMLELDEHGQRFEPAQQLERFRHAYSAVNDQEAQAWREWANYRWRDAAQRQYHHYFFEDNAGYLLASVSVTPTGDGKDTPRRPCT